MEKKPRGMVRANSVKARLEDDTIEALDKKAAAYGLTRSDAVREAIHDWLNPPADATG